MIVFEAENAAASLDRVHDSQRTDSSHVKALRKARTDIERTEGRAHEPGKDEMPDVGRGEPGEPLVYKAPQQAAVPKLDLTSIGAKRKAYTGPSYNAGARDEEGAAGEQGVPVGTPKEGGHKAAVPASYQRWGRGGVRGGAVVGGAGAPVSASWGGGDVVGTKILFRRGSSSSSKGEEGGRGGKRVGKQLKKHPGPGPPLPSAGGGRASSSSGPRYPGSTEHRVSQQSTNSNPRSRVIDPTVLGPRVPPPNQDKTTPVVDVPVVRATRGSRRARFAASLEEVYYSDGSSSSSEDHDHRSPPPKNPVPVLGRSDSLVKNRKRLGVRRRGSCRKPMAAGLLQRFRNTDVEAFYGARGRRGSAEAGGGIEERIVEDENSDLGESSGRSSLRPSVASESLASTRLAGARSLAERVTPSPLKFRQFLPQ